MPTPALPPPPPPAAPAGPSFGQAVKDKTLAILKWLARVFVAPGAAVLLVVGAVLLAVLGMKNVQIGGLLGMLFGKKKPEHTAIDVANSVPEGRVDAQGKIIQPGQADSKGMTQAVVVPIQNPGVFSNPDTVVFTPPGHDKPVEVQLPTGVKAKDVEKVIVVQPTKFVVTVKDSSGISAQHVDDLLKKYG
jgi:hypothetical protein